MSVRSLLKAVVPSLALAAVGLFSTVPAAAAGDPVRGKQLGYTCLGCHGIETYKDRLRKVYFVVLEFFEKNPQVGRMIHTSVSSSSWTNDVTFRQPELMRTFMKVLAEGREQGVLTNEVDQRVLLDVFLGVLWRLVHMYFARGMRHPPTREAEASFARARTLRETKQPPSIDDATFQAYLKTLEGAGLAKEMVERPEIQAYLRQRLVISLANRMEDFAAETMERSTRDPVLTRAIELMKASTTQQDLFAGAARASASTASREASRAGGAR